MEFFKNIKNSVYGPDFYSGLISKPFSYSLKYYLLFALFAAAIATVILSFSVLPQIKSALNDLNVKIFQNYPAELVVKIENGKASTNAKDPFFVKYPGNSNELENLLTIDTKNQFDLDKFNSYKSQCLLTETEVICRDDGQIKIQSLAKIPNITIDKDKVAVWSKRAMTFLNLIYPLFFIIVIVGFYLAITFRLAYLILFALLVWLVAKLKKVNIGYQKSYQLGLHLMTPALIITYLVALFAHNLKIPCFFTIIALVFAIINLKTPIKTENLGAVQNVPTDSVDGLSK
jgi:hypothetical protein